MKRIKLFSSSIIVVMLLAACASPVGLATEDTADLDLARQTLINFFSLLSHGDYESAVLHFADDAETDFFATALRNNADVYPASPAALMEAACTYQLRCMEILNVVSGEQVSDKEFVFTVEFANPDGTLFVLGPCCGSNETEMPPVSQFDYRVEKADSEFFVHGSPVYVP